MTKTSEQDEEMYLLTLRGLEQLCHGGDGIRGLELGSRCGGRICRYRGY